MTVLEASQLHIVSQPLKARLEIEQSSQPRFTLNYNFCVLQESNPPVGNYLSPIELWLCHLAWSRFVTHRQHNLIVL